MIIPQNTCPTHENFPGQLTGCGSTNVSEPDDEGLCDCLDCGIWFRPDDQTPPATNSPPPEDQTPQPKSSSVSSVPSVVQSLPRLLTPDHRLLKQ